MSNPLVPCPSCARHVRSDEPTCPFCTTSLPSDLAARAVPSTQRRLNRIAAFTFATSVAITGVVACGGSVDDGQDQSRQDDLRRGKEQGGVMPLYGAPVAEDGGSAPHDDGGMYALYGMPRPDAGPVEDSGSIHAMYGEPPLDGGSAHALYGLPPD